MVLPSPNKTAQAPKVLGRAAQRLKPALWPLPCSHPCPLHWPRTHTCPPGAAWTGTGQGAWGELGHRVVSSELQRVPTFPTQYSWVPGTCLPPPLASQAVQGRLMGASGEVLATLGAPVLLWMWETGEGGSKPLTSAGRGLGPGSPAPSP